MTISVKDMESGKGGLDKKMQKTLNAEEYPSIVFKLKGYNIKISTNNPHEPILLAQGSLHVAGVEKEITLEAFPRELNHTLQFKGKKDLLMTDFDIKPPKMMLGAIKTSNEVSIHFNLVLRKE